MRVRGFIHIGHLSDYVAHCEPLLKVYNVGHVFKCLLVVSKSAKKAMLQLSAKPSFIHGASDYKSGRLIINPSQPRSSQTV